MSSLFERLRAQFEQNPDAKLGFVVYRTTYEDDEAWASFLTLLTKQTIARIKSSPLAGLESRLDWNVQEDRSNLDKASFETVRDHFRKWVADDKEANHGTARHRVCVMIDEWSLDSAKNWRGDAEEFNNSGYTWVRLISRLDEGRTRYEQYDSDDEDDDEDGANENGEKKEEVEEKKDQISQCMVALSYVFPRTFELLEGPGWHNFAHPYNVVKE
ncbi:hypothetical protein P154DRAFT_537710 [Amniculicola lignicola CBS 123094]|uniref:Uncharacterized protein n=1 Tax=Amniculicola lignicola CBS 123094 TaxID=1392246 RepID=A0A6A5W7D7_9PLEO|nr:hypothetical protein P154DRAFT_537710 [Amniculicola lignicola CBS 123094]